MLTLIAKILDVIPTEKTDRKTGEVVKGFAAEVVHKAGAKSEIITLALDVSVAEHWNKSIGKEFTAQVRPWAIRTESGINAGYGLLDKKALPVLLASTPVLKAA